jgi:archaellum component FlaC
LPKDKEFQDRLRNLETKMFKEAQRENKELRNQAKSTSLMIDDHKKNLQTKKEKLEALKNKLKRRALDS